MKRLLFFAAAVETMGYGTVYVLLADLQDRYGLPTWGLGAIGGATFAAVLAAQTTLARYADRGHARRLLLAGLACAAAGMFWFAGATELWQFIGARVFIGLGSGMFLPAVRRVLLASGPVRTGELLGRLASVEVLGFVVGPPVAAALNAIGGLRAPFLVQGALLVACLPPVRRVPEPPVGAERAPARALRTVAAIPAVRAGLLIGAGFQLTVGTYEATWSRFFKDHGASTGVVAITLTLFPLPLIFLSARGGRFADRIGATRAGRGALVASVPLVLCFAVLDSLLLLFLVSMAQAVVHSVLLPAGQAAVAHASPRRLLAVGQGLFGAVGAAAAGAAALGGAALYDAVGASAMWVSVAVASLLVAGASAAVERPAVPALPVAVAQPATEDDRN